ncbi:uncharacterized protein QC763_0105070 [Podospora pseudopauciseta]|uniref:Uncharacterized protein n=1 Tax=Podospora pseudopauciseta TaxID=2093780 RepID=A0ABR0H0S8_9PEZI|nr:hypothetical protein QC763_0105070 [Podospora pseudopauciseta]
MADAMSYLASAHSSSGGACRGPQSRAYRRALHRYAKQINALPSCKFNLLKPQEFFSHLGPDAKAFHKNNPQCFGLPRSYSVRVVQDDNAQAAPAAAQAIEGKTIVIGQHGSDSSGLQLGSVGVKPSDVNWFSSTNSYVFDTVLEQPSAQLFPQLKASRVSGYVSLEGNAPAASIAIGSDVINVELDKKASWYDVEVAANAGAYLDTHKSTLAWDVKSDKWTNASWEEGKFTWGYDIANRGNDLQEDWVAENMFLDNYSDPPTEFNLTMDLYGPDYTCIIGESTDDGAFINTTITNRRLVPPAPAQRSQSAIKSVFPVKWKIQMTPFADSFVGAYEDSEGVIYAVKGSLRLEESADESVVAASMTEDLSVVEGTEKSFSAMSVAEAQSFIMAAAADAPPKAKLAVHQLMTFDPMVQDKEDPSGYRDSVATVAMKDFQNIIIYHMDEDLRTTFISASQVHLEPEVLAVANDDPGNAAWYKTLQVPLITSVLAQGTTEWGKHCNGARAAARLKSIPAESEVYKRHSAKLYRYRYFEKFPAMKEFLSDQRNGGHKEDLKKFADRMKEQFKAKTSGLGVGNPDFEKNLTSALAEIDNLAKWARDKNLYWAMQLLYWVQNSAVKMWYGQYMSGSVSSSVAMRLKQLNTLFGILEDNANNTKPGGKSFMQAFNEEVRLYQMTAIIPQMVDLTGNTKQDIDDLVKECLDQYIKQYQNIDMEAHKEAIEAALLLYQQDELRRKVFKMLFALSRTSSTLGSWGATIELWHRELYNRPWFQNVAKIANSVRVLTVLTSVVVLVQPLLTGEWRSMSPEQKVKWGFALGGLAGMLIIEVAQGTLRLYQFWGDMAAKRWYEKLGTAFGWEGAVNKIENGALRVQKGFGSWFTRTAEQTKDLAARIAAKEEGLLEFSRFEKIFGRNVGEFMGAVLGVVLGIVSIVLILIELDSNKDGLLQAMDWIMFTSSVIQVAGIILGWVAAGLGAAYSGLALVAAWSGPIAIVFAVIGIILFLVWYFTTDHRDPIQKFVEDKARPAGLWVDNPMQASDYIRTVPAVDQNPSLPGLTFKGPMRRAGDIGQEDTSSIDAKYLHLGKTEGAVDLGDALDYTSDTIWSFETDAYGKSLIYTKRIIQEKDRKRAVLWYLSTDGSNNAIVKQRPGADPEWKALLPSLQWEVEVLEPPKVDGKKNVLASKARIRRGNLDLGRTFDRGNKQPGGLVLVDVGKYEEAVKKYRLRDIMYRQGHGPRPELPGPAVPFYVWEVEMEAMGPGNLEYSSPKWVLTNKLKNERNYPKFDYEPSDAMRWSISPPLDANSFELITAAGQDGGIVKQKDGVEPPLMSPTTYTVTCTVTRGGKDLVSCQANFTLEVITEEELAKRGDEGDDEE